MFRSGDQIGPYTLIRSIGKGAFGVVWLAEKRSRILTTQVALKMPLDQNVDIEVIKQEASVWKHASGHPNVVSFLDADEYDSQIVIVSEYVPDGSMEDWLEKHGGAPSMQAAIDKALGILAGLEHLHARNIIHRDLKPANLLLQGETPRLTDFGISRVLKTTSVSQVAGTPAYMAPESFDGVRNEQTDVWSVGVLLYQMLAGRLPFPQQDMTSLIGAIVSRNPDPLPPDLPPPLRGVVMRALAKNPAQRFLSASEMRMSLQKAAEAIKAQRAEPVVNRVAPPAFVNPPGPPRPMTYPQNPEPRTSPPNLNPRLAQTMPVRPLFTQPPARPSSSKLPLIIVGIVALLVAAGVVAAYVLTRDSGSNFVSQASGDKERKEREEKERAEREAAEAQRKLEEEKRQREAEAERQRQLELSKPKGAIQQVWTDHNVFEGGQKGMRIHAKFTVDNYKGINCRMTAYFYFENGDKLKDNNGSYKTDDGQVSVGKDFNPTYVNAIYNDYTVFLPYDELHLGTGKFSLKYQVKLYRQGGEFFASSEYQTFTFTK